VPPGSPVLVVDAEGCQAIWVDRIARWGVPPEKVLFPGDGFTRVTLDDADALKGIRETACKLRVQLLVSDSLRQALEGPVHCRLS
jgi:hypothetical protein